MVEERNENGLTQKEWIAQVDECCHKEFKARICDILGDFETWIPWCHGEDAKEYWNEQLRDDCLAEASEMLRFAEEHFN